MAGRTGTRGVPRPQREAQMLEVAGDVFAERGFHAASMDDIAERAGISKPMLYAYFDSKDGLYLACIEQAGRRLVEAMDAAIAPGLPGEEQLWRAVLAFLGYVDEHRQGWAVLYREAAARGGRFAEVVAPTRAALARRTAALLAAAFDERGLPRSDAEPLAQAFIGAGESLANWWIDHPEEPLEAVACRLMETGWLGLRQVTRGEAWRASAPAAPTPPGG